MMSQRGIEANLEKVKAILEMTSPKTMKEVQRLTGQVTTLNRFVLKATNKCLTFFKTLKQAFEWINECMTTFKNLKEYLTRMPLLNLLVKEENLFLYLVISQTAVSLALTREENRMQRLVYQLSQAFQGAEVKYPRLEKVSFALIVASRKLRPYFQAHPIIVMTDQPIKKAE